MPLKKTMTFWTELSSSTNCVAALQANLMNYMRRCMGAKGSKVTVNQLLGGRSFDPGMTRQEITEYFRQRGKEIGK